MRGATVFANIGEQPVKFQSTRPMRGATTQLIDSSVTRPMRGATTQLIDSSTKTTNFNPRAPCGARLPYLLSAMRGSEFQSTRPMRGATTGLLDDLIDIDRFQSTRPMRGATF